MDHQAKDEFNGRCGEGYGVCRIVSVLCAKRIISWITIGNAKTNGDYGWVKKIMHRRLKKGKRGEQAMFHVLVCMIEHVS